MLVREKREWNVGNFSLDSAGKVAGFYARPWLKMLQ